MKKTLIMGIGTLVTTTLFLGIGSSSVEAKDLGNQVKSQMESMTIEQKVGQMLQPDTRSIQPEDIKDNYIGSILSGGGASPEEGNTAKDWADRLDKYQKAAVEGFGIPLLYGVDAVHGHNNVKDATIFPHNIGLGQANDEELMKKIALATAEEMRATGAHWTFTPTLGLPKNERWGRTYECFGEDAELSAKLGKAYIQGSQGELNERNAIATAKHFIGEGITKDGINQGDVPLEYESEAFQKVLKEELLVPYKEAIEADVKSVMVTYNSINGVKSHGNKTLLTELLKEELGFKGIVLSDYNGVDQIEGDLSYKEKVIKGVNAGIDMMMVDGYEGTTPKWQLVRQAILDGVKEDKISEARIDDAVERILSVKKDMGLMDNNAKSAYANRELLTTVGGNEHRKLAREAVQSSLALLKNSKTDNSTLINDLKNMNNIVVAGSSANDIGMQSGGWTISWQGSIGNTTKGTTILDGLKEVAKEGTTIDYSKDGTLNKNDYEAAILVMGEEPYAEYAGDVVPAELKLSNKDTAIIKKIKQSQPDLPIVAVLTTGRPITIVHQLEDLDAIVMAGFPGSEGAGVADILLGDKDFTGKLTMRWPWYAQDIEKKFTDESKVLFETGRGLTKNQTTAIKTQVPEDPTIIDLKESTGVIQAEKFVDKHKEVVMENDQTSIGHFWEDRYVTYNVSIPESARYTFSINTATAESDTKVAFDIYVDGKLYYQANQVLSNTGGWSNFKELEFTEKVSLPKGKHELKFVSRARNYNIDYFKFIKFDEQFEEPTEENNPPESDGSGAVIKEGAVKVNMSSSENSQNMSWYTAPQEIENKNTAKEDLTIRNIDDSDVTSIVVNDKEEYQKALGVGISLEESTVSNMLKMSPDKRKKFIQQLIDPIDGMGNTLIRLTIGTSDFTGQDFYTYYDGTGKELAGKPDWNNDTGKGFSIQKDKDVGIIQIVKEVQEIAKELGVENELRFFASSWTPPGWMKLPTNASNSFSNNELLLKGGTLNDDHIQDLAKYYVRYVEEYAKEGIPIYAMTLQNEPLLEIDYPSCYITGAQEAKMSKAIKEELGKSAHLTTQQKDVKVWAFDHNFDGADSFVKELFDTEDGRENVDGIAFHPYGGVPSTMGNLYNQYKDEYSMHLTERSVWGTNGANDIIDWFRNGSQSYNGWVTMLDSNIAPHQWVGTPDPTMFVQDANNRENYWSTPEVYIVGQFSKYIRPGFIRINSNNGGQSTVTNVAFKDPKTGRIILIVTNRSKEDQPFKVIVGKTQFNAILPVGNTATYTWDPVDTTGVKELTDELTLDDATLTGKGEIIDGKILEKIDRTTRLDYYVNVKKAGTYKVEFEAAAGGDQANNFPIQVSQDSQVLGTAHIMRHHLDNEENAWTDYTKVQTYVRFEKEGLQTFSIDFPEGGMNFKNVHFTKSEMNQTIPGALTPENYFDQKGLVFESGEQNNFGFIERDDYVDYKIDVQKTAKYDLLFDVSTINDTSGVWIDSIDNDKNQKNIADINFKLTNGLNNYDRQAFSIDLNEGKQTLRIKFKSDQTKLRQIIIGNGIKVTQPELIEGALDKTTFTVDLLSGKFEVLEKAKWTLDLPEGLDFNLERVNDTQIKVTLSGEAENDFDQNLLISLLIDASQVNGIAGTVLKETIVITAIDDDESLLVPKEIAFGQKKVDIEIEGGTFNKNVAEHVSLSDNLAKYVEIETIDRLSNKKISLTLKWNTMYGDMIGTIKVSSKGYSDGTAALFGEITFKGTDALPEPISLKDDSLVLLETLAYRNKGSLKENAVQGNYLDYFLGVEEEGDYLIRYQVKNNQAIGNGLKLSGGMGLATDNLASISFPNLWGNTLEYRNMLHLQSGDQTLRFEMNAQGYEIQEISIEKIKDSIEINENTILDANQIIDGSKDKMWIIEEKENLKNIGSTTAGAYVDYQVNVATAGTYQFMVNAGGDVTNGKAVLQTIKEGKVTDLGSVEVENTKDWGKFADSQTVEVTLDSGKQILRIFFKDAGFNYRHARLAFLRSGADKTKLVALLSEVTALKSTDYTVESWNHLMEKVTIAQSLIENQETGQSEIDQIIEEVTQAKNNLIPSSEVEPESIQLNVSGIKTLKKTKELQLEPTLSPSEAVTTITWMIEKDEIAGIDAKGNLLAKEVGTTRVTAKTSNGKTASFVLRVTN